MIYEITSIASVVIILLATIFIFYLQTKFTKGFMKSFVMNSAISSFLILSERFVDIWGEFIYGITNELYHLVSILLILGAVVYFFRAIKALDVLKSFITDKKL